MNKLHFKEFLARELPLISKSDPKVLTDLLLVHLENLDHEGVESTMEAVDRDLFDFITSARDRVEFSEKLHSKLLDMKREANSSASSSSSSSFRGINDSSARHDNGGGHQGGRQSRSRSRERQVGSRTNDASSSSSSVYHERQDYGPPSSSFAPYSQSGGISNNNQTQTSFPMQYQAQTQHQQQFGAAPSQTWQLPPNTTWQQQQQQPNFQLPPPPLFGGVGIGGPAISQQPSMAFQRPPAPLAQPAQQQNQGQQRAQRTLCAQNCHGAAADKNALNSHFSNFGTVLDVHVTGAPPKQTAFVLFSDAASCDQAVASRGLVCGESNIRLMYANYEAKVQSGTSFSTSSSSSSSSTFTGGSGGEVSNSVSNKERLLQQQQQQQHQLAMQMQRQQEKAERERAAAEAAERAAAAAAAEAAKRETSVDKAHRVIQAKAKEADDLQLAITAQKEMMIKFKEQKSTMSAEEQAATLAAIRAQAAKIKAQQGKLNAAVTTAKMAVDNTKKEKKVPQKPDAQNQADKSTSSAGETVDKKALTNNNIAASQTASSGVDVDKDSRGLDRIKDDDNEEKSRQRHEDENDRNAEDEEEESSFVIED
jgi:hypothetical protein